MGEKCPKCGAELHPINGINCIRRQLVHAQADHAKEVRMLVEQRESAIAERDAAQEQVRRLRESLKAAEWCIWHHTNEPNGRGTHRVCPVCGQTDLHTPECLTRNALDAKEKT